MEIRKDIQLLRGIAVLIVVLFHLQVPLFQNGFLGVDIFFVISGFLMAKLYDKGTIIDFYKRRIDRLFPAYAVTIFSALIAGYFLLIPVDFSQLFEQAIAGIFFVSNIFFWNQNSYFDKAAFNPLLNLWSLAVEIQFYIIVPFLYRILRNRKWLLFIVFMTSIALCFFIQMISPKTSFFLMPLRIWEFLIGAWIAWYGIYNIDKLSYKKYVQILLLFALIALPFLFTLKPDATGSIALGHPALPALLVTILTGLVIFYGLPISILESSVGRVLHKIGDYSYSIYLIHFPLIVLYNYEPFGGTILGFTSSKSLLFACLLIAVLSTCSYLFIERKWARALNVLLVRTTLIGIVIVSAFILSHLNLNKYDEVEKNIFSAWTDRDTYRCGKIFRILNPVDAICPLISIEGDKKVLLVGNSHADSIKKAFSETAKNLRISSYFVVSNDPLMNSTLDSNKIFHLATQYKIDTVFIHFSNVYDNPKIKDEIVSLIKLCKSSGIKLVVIGPVPTYEVHIPKAMFMDRSFMFATNLKAHKERTHQYLEFVGQLELLDVNTYDPALLLCPEFDKCNFSDSQFKPYYFDLGHLTLTGADVLVPLFKESLNNVK